ncbi:uncharacterized protein PAC_03727 [Phialocephala subalpina]|uniref:Uncharacterized protein n=1 Tax=Phialocephala subalpina TaxID=576137 RepID=A0A1L7WM75_9HELO|nr:uncharacterized protein PAC_03727 [Phialocephala subalpina]
MATEGVSKSAKQAKEDFAVISNRLAVAFAKRESLIKSWTASSSRPQQPTKTEEELDAEDALLFRNQPQYLGVGAAIPSHFLVSEAERNNKSLRAKFFPTKGLKASKARDAEEKAASAKRALREESSEEEEGRSGLGRAKKLKMTRKAEPEKNAVKEDTESEEESRVTMVKAKKPKTQNAGVVKDSKGTLGDAGQTPSKSAEPTDLPITANEDKLEDGMDTSKCSEPDPEVLDDIGKKREAVRPTDPAELKRLKKREKRRRQKLRAAQKDSNA